MRIRILVLTLLAVSGLTAQRTYAQQAPAAKVPAYKSGEKLTYVVRHSAVDSDVIEVVFKTTATILNNKETLKIYANASTLPSYKIFFDMSDTYETWIDMNTLRPVQFSCRLKEGKYRFMADYVYDWDAYKVHTEYRNLKRPNLTYKTLDLKEHAGDALAIFYNMRTVGFFRNFREGESRDLLFVQEDKISTLKYRFIGRETRKFGKTGTFKTIKLACQLSPSSEEEGQTFKEGTEFFIWLSDDDNLIPIYFESPIKIGSVVVVLRKYEGLKYPLSSKIK